MNPASWKASLTTPKSLITILITTILVLGEWAYGAAGGYEKLAVTLGVCVATEIACGWFLLGKFPRVQSAYISGISLTILLRPQGGLIWPFVLGAMLSIGCKYVLRYRNRHLWNPSNFGITALLLLAPSQVAILSHELGNHPVANGIIWVLGLLIAGRARILHVTVTYVLVFLALVPLRSLVAGTPLLAEVSPLTGPMYQLLVFFMLTDPATTVRSRKGRMITVAIIAVLEAAFRMGNDLGLAAAAPFAPAPPIFALAIVGPIAFWLSLRQPKPAPRPAAEPAV